MVDGIDRDCVVINEKTIEGEYFNDVMKSVQRASPDALLGTVARWLTALQAYLSGPAQGGIRHGRQLHLEGLQLHDAALLFNLTRSYISYLLAEYEQLNSTTPAQCEE